MLTDIEKYLNRHFVTGTKECIQYFAPSLPRFEQKLFNKNCHLLTNIYPSKFSNKKRNYFSTLTDHTSVTYILYSSEI